MHKTNMQNVVMEMPGKHYSFWIVKKGNLGTHKHLASTKGT